MAEFTYDRKLKRYRRASGTFVSQTTLRAAQNKLIVQEQAVARSLARRAVAGEIGMDQFVTQMRANIRTSSAAQYMLGRGGRGMMTSADWGRVGQLVKPHYQYLQRFAEQLNAEQLSVDAAMARAESYVESTRVMYDRGRAAAFDVELPAWPKDGTECGPGCRCSWSISETASEVRAYWRTNASKSCATCQQRASEYSPYVVPKS